MGYEPSRVYEGGFQFQKHYFGPKPGELSEKTADGQTTEEFRCAQFLDGLPQVQFWVRNLPRKPTSFRLQTSTDWFYPDFLCQLDRWAGAWRSNTRASICMTCGCRGKAGGWSGLGFPKRWSVPVRDADRRGLFRYYTGGHTDIIECLPHKRPPAASWMTSSLHAPPRVPGSGMKAMALTDKSQIRFRWFAGG